MSTASSVDSAFRSLGRDVYISEGAEGAGADRDPLLIVVFGWMDAPTALLHKYTGVHRATYPAATIVLVKTQSSFLWTSAPERERTLEPVADILMSKIYNRDEGEGRPGLLIHVISNGGGFQLMLLSSILKRRVARQQRPSSTFPTALVIDSTPGTNEYQSMVRTFTTSVHAPAARAALHCALPFVYAGYYTINRVLGNAPLLPLLQAFLARADVLPACSAATPRLYVYSDADQMVPCAAVEHHLDVVRARQFQVRTEKYSGSAHVSHMRQDPRRYWDAVRETWALAVAQNGGVASTISADVPVFRAKL